MLRMEEVQLDLRIPHHNNLTLTSIRNAIQFTLYAI